MNRLFMYFVACIFSVACSGAAQAPNASRSTLHDAGPTVDAGLPDDAGLFCCTYDAGVDAGPFAGCDGDMSIWNGVLADPLTCSSNADCCVARNNCLNEAVIVTKGDLQSASNAWPYCPWDCTHCITPDVLPKCVQGVCVGVLDNDAGYPTCGTVELPGELFVDAGETFDAGPRLFGCSL